MSHITHFNTREGIQLGPFVISFSSLKNTLEHFHKTHCKIKDHKSIKEHTQQVTFKHVLRFEKAYYF